MAAATARTIAARITQPIARTHPHLFAHAGELTPGITAAEYAQRRHRLMAPLNNGDVAVLVGHPTTYTSYSIFNPFHQNTNFLYLTGLDEPDCAVVLEKDARSANQHTMTMFLAVKSEQEQRWSGGTTGISAAKSVFGADSAYDNSLFSEYMRQLISDRRTVYLDDRSKLASSDLYPVKKHDPASSVAPQWFSGLRSVLDKSIRPLSSRVQELRAIKSPAELQVMQKVADISCNGFRTVMRSRASYESEHHLAAAYEYDIKRQGASGYGYIPVVAGGANACTLHYVYNDMPLRKGELLLMDAGARYGGYVSDITRTWPVDGQLSPAQRDLYEVVLTVQRECIKHCTESSGKSLDQIHEISVDILFRELQRLGFTGSRYEVCQQLYFHHVGHYLGMDVHDTPAISRSRKLRAGMVVTIEPGVYVPPLSSMPQKYHHIGIRIEDDVVVGETVPTVLTASAPKETADVEQ